MDLQSTPSVVICPASDSDCVKDFEMEPMKHVTSEDNLNHSSVIEDELSMDDEEDSDGMMKGDSKAAFKSPNDNEQESSVQREAVSPVGRRLSLIEALSDGKLRKLSLTCNKKAVVSSSEGDRKFSDFCPRPTFNGGQNRRLSLLEALQDTKTMRRLSNQTEVESHFDSSEEQITSSESDDDSDASTISNLLTSMKDYYLIRKETTPLNDEMYNTCLQSERSATLVKSSTSSKDDHHGPPVLSSTISMDVEHENLLRDIRNQKAIGSASELTDVESVSEDDENDVENGDRRRSSQQLKVQQLAEEFDMDDGEDQTRISQIFRGEGDEYGGDVISSTANFMSSSDRRRSSLSQNSKTLDDSDKESTVSEDLSDDDDVNDNALDNISNVYDL